MRIFFSAFLMLFTCAYSAKADIITSSSAMVDLCAGFKANDSVAHKPMGNVTMNSFDFEFDKKVLIIPIKIETLQALGVSDGAMDNYNIEPDLGNLELHPDGSLYYQGQQIGSSSLTETCKKRAGGALMGNEKDFIEGDSSYG